MDIYSLWQVNVLTQTNQALCVDSELQNVDIADEGGDIQNESKWLHLKVAAQHYNCVSVELKYKQPIGRGTSISVSAVLVSHLLWGPVWNIAL